MTQRQRTVVLALVAGLIGAVMSQVLVRKPEPVEKKSIRSIVDSINPPHEKVIRAEKFQLVDEEGNERGLIEYDPKNETTRMHIGRGLFEAFARGELESIDTCSFNLIQSDSSVNLNLSSKKGAILVECSKDGASISFANKTGFTNKLTMGFDSEGNPGLYMFDEKGTMRTALGKIKLEVTKTGESRTKPPSSLVLFDKDGKVMWETP